VSVFLVVRAIPITVLEVDTEIFDRLAAELVDDQGVHPLPQGRRDTKGAGKFRRAGCELRERATSGRAEAWHGVGTEQVSASIHRVHGLSSGAVT
jgi:hypothetical protein